MIHGIGTDLVVVSRFAQTLADSPRLAERLFTATEREGLSTRSLAASFAAKEALAKALGAPGDLGWHEVEVIRMASGEPRLRVLGGRIGHLVAQHHLRLHVTMSHDGDLASATVIAEALAGPGAGRSDETGRQP